MIPLAKNIVVQDNLGSAERGKFSIDESSIAHIMSVLTNLYKDPIAAVVREYLSNAYDAQVEAGQVPGEDSWVPIKVTLPGRFDTIYRVRDFGIGMNTEDMDKVYSKYGYSSKRQRNDAVGMLGLGSKAALTYVNSFTVVGFKDGVRTTAFISVDDTGVPEYVIADVSPTSEPNGVEVSFAVKNSVEFTRAFWDILGYWPSGLVSVDGSGTNEQRNFGTETEPGSGIFYKMSSNSWRTTSPTLTVVMGNVAYPVDSEMLSDTYQSAAVDVTAFVPIGSMSITPSREALYYDQATKQYIEKVVNDTVKVAIQGFIDNINAAKTWQEFCDEASKVPHWALTLPEINTLNWKGLTVGEIRDYHKNKIVLSRTDGHSRTLTAFADGEYASNSLDRIVKSELASGAYDLIVDGHKATSVSIYNKSRARTYLASKGKSSGTILLISDASELATLDYNVTPIMSMADFKKLNHSAKTKASVKKDPEYSYTQIKDGKVGGDFKATNVPGTVIYVGKGLLAPTRWSDRVYPAALAQRIAEFEPKGEFSLVVIEGNRVDKFLRYNKKAVTYKSWAIKHAEAVNRQIESIPVVELENKTRDMSLFLEHMDDSLIDDPDLQKVVSACKSNGSSRHSLEAKFNKLMQWQKITGNSTKISQPTNIVTLGVDFNKYPLLSLVGWRQKGTPAIHSHMIEYVNSVYRKDSN